ncbi:hypothetical protein BB560_003309 [Smittium megazygosporum]|uniref:Fe2OG dioxygenase domain-containing protein n=1 Tax=Smittium megazygosporum TaxID=133381 RepID=A0A2T9ZCB4_9FUNG|nr:hypothetical protein BB560_003309 [Smittium megazygosporum]
MESQQAKRFKPASPSQEISEKAEAAPENFQDCFAQDFFSQPIKEKFKSQYEASFPYKHCQLHPIFNDQLLKDVRDEILTKLSFTQKETDIYNYDQTGDLANLDGLPLHEKLELPKIRLLRDAVYSSEFRDFVSTVTGCGPLSGKKTDMSANIYKDKSYLLLHDDVIEDRRVSFIIYLPTFEGEDWVPENGGSLELYPSIGNTNVPNISPSQTLPISWNRMAFFIVEPGHSFHAVEEVVALSKDVRRISIQGWFHVPQEGEIGYSKSVKDVSASPVSTLNQIRSGDSLFPFIPVHDSSPVDDENKDKNENQDKCKDKSTDEQTLQLSQEDKDYLRKFMNPEYLDEKIIVQTRDLFAEQSFIQLGKFINKNLEAEIKKLITEADKYDGLGNHKVGKHGTAECGRWRARGPSVIRRYLELDGPSGSNTENKGGFAHEELAESLSMIREELFCSAQFRKWIEYVTSVEIGGYRGSVRRFRPGLDYTLASPTGNTNPTIDANLSFTVADDPEQTKLWQSGEVGGYECYITADEDDTQASVYKRADNDEPLLTVPAGWNTLNLVYCEQDVLKFVKYLSASAPASRLDLFYEYQSI